MFKWLLRSFLLACCFGLISAQGLDFPVTANMDTGTSSGSPKYVWYEQGLNHSVPGSGLPPAETPFASQSHSNRFYIFESYTNANVILITSRSGQTTGMLTFATSAPFTTLSVAASSAGGALNLDAIVHHADGAKQTNQLRVNDWYMSSNAIWTAHGRFDIGTSKFDPASSNAWRIYAHDILLTNSTSSVTAVEFRRKPNQFFGNAAVFGISGSNGEGFTPIAVAGFNQDVAIEASHSFELLPNLRGNFAGNSLTGAPGEVTNIGMEFWNYGNAPSIPVQVHMYLRPPHAALLPDYKVGELTLQAFPPNGVPAGTNFAMTAPPTTPLGRYEVVLWIDPEEQMPEVSKADNQRIWPIVIGPELGIPFINAYVLTNGLRAEIVFGAQIMNSGSGAGETTADLWLDRGTTNEAFLARFDLPEFWPQRRWDIELGLPLPPNLTAGMHPLTLVVDPDNIIPEASEGNERTFQLEVTDQHLAGIAAFSAAVENGTTLRLTGRPAVNAEVLGSTNLVDWYPVQEVQAGEDFTLERATSSVMEFFQIKAAAP